MLSIRASFWAGDAVRQCSSMILATSGDVSIAPSAVPSRMPTAYSRIVAGASATLLARQPQDRTLLAFRHRGDDDEDRGAPPRLAASAVADDDRRHRQARVIHDLVGQLQVVERGHLE